MDKKLTIEHNTCIISSNLLDELDYVIGGYGPPTLEFIFNFNAFVESYILSSHFIMPHHEMEHIKITKNVLFPNGRPVLELILNSKRLSLVGGFGNQLMRCVYVNKVETTNQLAAEKAIEEFTKREADAIKKNFILSDFSKKIDDVKTYSIGFAGKDQPEFGSKNQVLIGETSNKPFEIVQSFFDKITNLNVQSALPVFTYHQQLSELGKKAVSKEIYNTISKLQGETIQDAENYLGSELQTIPPLVSIVLSKAKDRDAIPFVLNEIRADFTDFRNCCVKFEQKLNDAQTMKEQLDTIKEYKEFWSTLVRKYSDQNSRIMFRFLDIAKDSNYENSLDNFIDKHNPADLFKDLNMGKVVGKAGFFVWDKIKEKRIMNRFKGVVNLWSLLEKSPTIDKQISDIERLFGTSLNRKGLVRAKRYLGDIKKAIPQNTLPKT